MNKALASMPLKTISVTQLMPSRRYRPLAELVGVTRQTIGLIEAGKYNPTLKLCLALAKVTGKRLDELFWIKGDR